MSTTPANTPDSGSSGEGSSTVKLALAAQAEVRKQLNGHRLEALRDQRLLKEVGGKDCYEEAIIHLLEGQEDRTLTLGQLKTVLPDHAELTKAKKSLVEQERVTCNDSTRSQSLTLLN